MASARTVEKAVAEARALEQQPVVPPRSSSPEQPQLRSRDQAPQQDDPDPEPEQGSAPSPSASDHSAPPADPSAR